MKVIKENLLGIDVESFKDFIYLFEQKDRDIAAIIFEEKPTLKIIKQKSYIQLLESGFFVGEFKDEPYYCVIAPEWGDDFYLDSGLSLADAAEFCKYYQFNYTT